MARQLDVRGIDLGDVLGEIAVRRQAIGAPVALSDGDRDALGCGWRDTAGFKRPGEPEVSLEHGRAGHRLHHVRRRAELDLNRIEQLFRLSVSLAGVDVGDACHVVPLVVDGL